MPDSQRNGTRERPILFLDVDGVISLFGFAPDAWPGRLQLVDGIPHCIGHGCGERIGRLAERFELVWATGWEETANVYLPPLLGLGRELPCLRFDGRATWGSAHWKLEAIDRYAGDRPAAWIDDNLTGECLDWSNRRPAPTLLIRTDPAVGLTDAHVQELLAWAERV